MGLSLFSSKVPDEEKTAMVAEMGKELPRKQWSAPEQVEGDRLADLSSADSRTLRPALRFDPGILSVPVTEWSTHPK